MKDDQKILDRLTALMERHSEEISRHSEEISLLTKVQLEQHRILRDHDEHMLALTNAIHHLAEKIGASQ